MRAQRGLLLLLVALVHLLHQSHASSFRFGSLTWRRVGNSGNKVEFELHSAWRRDFHWPKTFGDTTTYPDVGDVIRIAGLSFADPDLGGSVAAGTSDMKLHAGDGTAYFVDVTVTSINAQENWFMGIFRVEHTYSSPYASVERTLYPDGYSYEAGEPGSLNSNQPFQHRPWEAFFGGCCRLDAIGNNGGKPFRLSSKIDLTDMNNAPAMRVLPVVTVKKASSSSVSDSQGFWLTAKDHFMEGRVSATAKSGGNSALPTDDNKKAPLHFELATAAHLGLSSQHFSPWSYASVDNTTGLIRIESFTPSVALYNVVIKVSAGTAVSFVDFLVRVTSSSLPTVIKPPVSVTNIAPRQQVDSWVGYPVSFDIEVHDSASNELNLQFTLADLIIGKASASDTRAALLPSGTVITSISNPSRQLVTDIALSFDNPANAHAPGVEGDVAQGQRAFVGHPSAATLSVNKFEVHNTNLNQGAGGAYAYLWSRKMNNSAAITDIYISANQDDERWAAANRFEDATVNVNEETSSSTVVKVWVRRAASKPITSIAVRLASANSTDLVVAGWERVAGSLNNGTTGTHVHLYILREVTSQLSRRVEWTPARAGHFAFLFTGKQANTPQHLSSTMAVVDIAVYSDPGPVFISAGLPSTVQATMGKPLLVNVTFKDQPGEIVNIDFDGTPPVGASLLPQVSVSEASGLKLFIRTLQWTPEPAHGGFAQPVCFKATDAAGNLRSPDKGTGCISVAVRRCVWHAQAGDTLGEVARRFGPSNWLQMWHFNPAILHPDTALVAGMDINVGRVYTVVPNDNLPTIANRFASTVEHLKRMNFNLASSSSISEGQQVCIVPNSCAAAKFSQL